MQGLARLSQGNVCSCEIPEYSVGEIVDEWK